MAVIPSPTTVASIAAQPPTYLQIMSLWAPAPPPPTALGRHRRLSTLAGVHVSPICLGAMSIGDKWVGAMGESSKESCFKLLDAFYDAGGNFIDTANNYQDETSEEFIGEWMETRGIRDQIVVATKVGSTFVSLNLNRRELILCALLQYSSDYKRGQDNIKQHSAYVLPLSLESASSEGFGSAYH